MMLVRYSEFAILGSRPRRFPWSRFSVDELRLRLDIVARHYDAERIDAMVALLHILRQGHGDDTDADTIRSAHSSEPLHENEVDDFIRHARDWLSREADDDEG